MVKLLFVPLSNRIFSQLKESIQQYDYDNWATDTLVMRETGGQEMKIVGVNMDNLDNNLDMVTRGQQQQQQPRTF